MAVAMGLGRFSYTLILPGMMDGLGLSASEAGWIASANYFGYLFGAVVAGYGWAAGAERRVAVGSVAATALLLLAMALTTSMAAFLVIRFLAGVASAFVMVFTTAIVLSHGIAAGRQHVQSAHFGGVGGGIAVSSVLIGLLTAAGVGLAGRLVRRLRALGARPRRSCSSGCRPGRPRPAPPAGNRRCAGRATSSRPRLPTEFSASATSSPRRSSSPSFATRMAASRPRRWSGASPAWPPRRRSRSGRPSRAALGLARTFVAGCLVEAVGVAASVLVPLPAGPIVGGVLLGGTFIMVTAYGLQIGRMLAPESPRRALAVMTAAFGTGQIVGPIVAGYLADWSGSFTLASLAAALGLLLSASIILTVRRI